MPLHQVHRAHLQSKNLVFKLLPLLLCQQKVLPQLFLLIIERVNDHTHKQIHYEQRAENNHCQEEQ